MQKNSPPSDEGMTPAGIRRSWEHNMICRAGEHFDWTGGKPLKGERIRRETIKADVIVEFCSRQGKAGYLGPSYLGLCWEHYLHRRERHATEWLPLIGIGHIRIHYPTTEARARARIHLVKAEE